MEEWARLKNIQHFERDLASETDPERRRRLEAFIAEERARVEEIRRAKEAAKPPK